MFAFLVYFREFFYIQMEKYARQALSEGVKSDSELHVTVDAKSSMYNKILDFHLAASCTLISLDIIGKIVGKNS